jgi:hypothetical protein
MHTAYCIKFYFDATAMESRIQILIFKISLVLISSTNISLQFLYIEHNKSKELDIVINGVITNANTTLQYFQTIDSLNIYHFYQ